MVVNFLLVFVRSVVFYCWRSGWVFPPPALELEQEDGGRNGGRTVGLTVA
jgi:hypothetical protein